MRKSVLATISVGAVIGALAFTAAPAAAKKHKPKGPPPTTTTVPRRDAVAKSLALAGVTNPGRIVVSPDGANVYVTDLPDDGPGGVLVIDTASGAQTRRISVGNQPNGLAASADGSRVYVVSFDDTVSVIDPRAGGVVNTIALGPNRNPHIASNISGIGMNPQGIAISPDGSRLYVAEFAEDGMTVIDTASNSVVDNVTVPDTGFYPTEVVVAPDGARAYLLYSGYRTGTDPHGTVSVIDTRTDAVLSTFPVGQIPVGLAISPDGTRIFVADGTDFSVSAYDSRTGAVALKVTGLVDPAGLAVSPDGSRLYVTSQSRPSVSVVDTRTGAIIQTIALSAVPQSVATSRDGSRAYVLNGAAVSVLESNGGH